MKLKQIFSANRVTLAIAFSIAVSSCAVSTSEPSPQHSLNQPSNNAINQAPKNIIMVVADGMGPAYVSAYRYYNDNPNTIEVETTIFDDILVGTSRTYPHQESGVVTDSAASATALATGVKTYNSAIGMDINRQPLETVLHRAHKLGLKTGLAVTSHIVHATPASYMVANESRRNYEEIADSFYDDRINGEHLADIMLGAGWGWFIREDRNLVEEFQNDGYQYIDKYSQLGTINSDTPVLGLFDDDSLPWALDDTDPLRLQTLTKAIVPYLENDKGYFLLLEASQVDWGGHANDIAAAMAEMHDLAKTIEYLVEHVQSHPDTLVVLTADHSTGGLTIGANGEYRWEPEFIKHFKKSISSMASEIIQQGDKGAYVSDMFGFSLSDDEIASVNTITVDMDVLEVEAVLKSIIDVRTNTGWTSGGHTGVDVDVFAFGPSAEEFKGNQNNTDLAHKIFELLEQRHRQ